MQNRFSYLLCGYSKQQYSPRLLYLDSPASRSTLFRSMKEGENSIKSLRPVTSILFYGIGKGAIYQHGQWHKELEIIDKTPKTRPRKSGSTFCCNNTVNGVNSGITKPTRTIKRDKSQKPG